jgi:GTPase SAR1 family protein
VYDITNPVSLENLDRWRKGFVDNCGPTCGSSFPFVVLGNKLDQEQDRAVQATEGQSYAKRHNMQFYETSAMTGTHVDDVFMEMAKAALKRDTSKDF